MTPKQKADKNYREKNKEKIALKNKEYREKNRDMVLKRQKEYRENNKKYIKADRYKRYHENKQEYVDAAKKYYQENKEKIKSRKKELYYKNIESRREYSRKYYQNHKKQRNLYEKTRRSTDVLYNIKTLIRSRFKENLKKKNIKQPQKYFELTGCSIEFLKAYLESKFKEGMSWENHTVDGWHIDHIIPCSSFDFSDPEQQKKCFHYTNLQPLWWYENLAKGSKQLTQ